MVLSLSDNLYAKKNYLDVCPICCSDFNANELKDFLTNKKTAITSLRLLKCQHVYHDECITKWFDTKTIQHLPCTCPLCNAVERESCLKMSLEDLEEIGRCPSFLFKECLKCLCCPLFTLKEFFCMQPHTHQNEE